MPKVNLKLQNIRKRFSVGLYRYIWNISLESYSEYHRNHQVPSKYRDFILSYSKIACRKDKTICDVQIRFCNYLIVMYIILVKIKIFGIHVDSFKNLTTGNFLIKKNALYVWTLKVHVIILHTFSAKYVKTICICPFKKAHNIL